MPVFSKLLPVISTAYGIQAIGALISIPLQEDRFYDLFGSLGFIGTGLVSLYYPELKLLWERTPVIGFPALTELPHRQLLLNAAMGLWAFRLGSFLLWRAIKHAGDSRLKKYTKNPKAFFFVWFGQAAWTLLVGLPVYLTNVLPKLKDSPLGPADYAPFALYSISFGLEILADYQKTRWRLRKDAGQHTEKFIKSGLWSISRHPNYAAEIGIWAGIWALALRALQDTAYPRLGPALTTVSPFFTYLLLTKGSGIPLLERAAKKKFGNNPEYQAYIRAVPLLWPWSSPKRS
ncbi:hypothetical protein M422DRAFT_156166 [Sphaerobolus stellatus SS14]|nr:hypothetical protein M422DRAFT_156166 [Sphaerobolus stellatus SS14]